MLIESAAAAVIAVLALIVGVPFMLERSRREVRADIATAQGLLYQRIDSLAQRLDGLHGSVGTSLSATADTLGRIGEQLGALGVSTSRILEVGRDVASLQDILRPPKLRGGFGELMMERLLAEVVPGRYVCQHRFRSGEVVDAVIHFGSGMVPVDSKFPLDSFTRMLAAEDDAARRAARREFERAVRGHIDAVARYIREDEGTMDFALMYVAAENVYYELMRDDAELTGGLGTLAYAQERHVFVVSPSTFYGYLSAIALGLRGLRVEERAREIVGHLGRLAREFEAFQRDFGILGGHLEGARKKYEGLNIQLTRLTERITLPLGDDGSEALEVDQPTLLAR
jgi:DNA recombination protein RmuC